jgi:hypothetical protein
MKKFEICIVSKEYRWLEIEAETPEDARDKAWGQLDNALNCKPEDYDTELFIEGQFEDAASYT